MATAKRKLPVLQSEPVEEPRPPWHWVGFGTVMIFTAWLPLAYIGAALVAPAHDGGTPGALGEGSLARLLVATIAPLVVATLAGGFLVGKFGKPAGTREALLAGLVTGLVAVGLTALSGPFSPLFLLVIAIATGSAGIGGAVGVRQRRV